MEQTADTAAVRLAIRRHLAVHPDRLSGGRLLRGAEEPSWMNRELERLQLQLSRHGTAPSLADGGVRLKNTAFSSTREMRLAA